MFTGKDQTWPKLIDPRKVDLQVVAACMREFTCVALYIYIFAILYSKLIHAARAGGGGSRTAKAAAAAAAACASSAKARLPVCLGSILARPGRPEKKISVLFVFLFSAYFGLF